VLLVSCYAFAQTKLRYGQTVSGEITSPGGKNEFIFDGEAGDKVSINVIKLKDTEGHFSPYVEIYDPNGNEMDSNFYGIYNVTLPTDDSYHFFIRDYNNLSIGTFELTLQRTNSPVNIKGLDYNTPTRDSLPSVSSTNTYRFNANRNDKITICSDVEAEGPAYFFVEMQLFDSAGNKLADSYAGGIRYTFSTSGVFYLFVRPGSTGTPVTYKLFLFDKDTYCPHLSQTP
jgi:hypothetical protein